MPEQTLAEAAWIAYRDEQHRKRPWCDAKRIGRQLRKRDFIAGFAAGQPTPSAAADTDEGSGVRG